MKLPFVLALILLVALLVTDHYLEASLMFATLLLIFKEATK